MNASLITDGPVGIAHAEITDFGPGRFVRVNRASCAILGYSEEEMLAMGPADISFPDEMEQEAAEFARLVSGEAESYEMEKRLIAADGKPVWVRLYVSLLRDERGVPREAVGQIIDITELKRLLAGQAAMIDSALDAVVGMDADGLITEFNPAAERVFGYSRSIVLGKPLADLIIPPTLREAHREGYRQAVAGGEPRILGQRTELTAMRADGSEFPVELTITRTQEAPPLFTGFIRDLTERKTAAEALEKSERRYRRIVETSSEGLWMLDADHRTTFVNPRMAEILGLRPQEMLGRHPFDFTDEEGRGRSREALDRRRQGVRESYQSKFIHRDGSEVWTWMSSSPLIEDDGSYGGELAMVTDVSDFVRAEREREELHVQLHQSQRLETVGQLAGGVAHDFNNLLAVILNYADFLREELDGSEEAAEGVMEIRRAAQRGAALTRRLLAFSRRDAGRPRTLDLRRVAGEVRRLLERTLGKDMELQIEMPEQLPPVTADVHQLEQVLLNLAVNARDAQDGCGVLKIALHEHTLGEQEARLRPGAAPGHYACIEVADDGAGMTAEVAAQAFEPFFTTKPAGEGTGLGLAMVYGIVKSAGGYVTLDSEPGAGTTVAVSLPVTTSVPEDDEGPDDPAPRRGAGQTVLVVDDEEPVRSVAARILSRHGYRVVEAGGGEEALAICASLDEGPDLLLTDVAMPRLNGLELARRLAGECVPAPAVVFMSGFSGSSVPSAEALDCAAGFIQKPFDAQSLLHGVAEALQVGAQPDR